MVGARPAPVIGQTGRMRTKLRNMLSLWGEAGLLVYVTMVNGEEIEGLVKEIDGDELVIEPMNEEGEVGSITVIQLQHVVTATYIEPQDEGEAAIERENPYLDADERTDPDQEPLIEASGLRDDEFMASPREADDTPTFAGAGGSGGGEPPARPVGNGPTAASAAVDATGPQTASLDPDADPALEADGG
jgi:hypothetical protein